MIKTPRSSENIMATVDVKACYKELQVLSTTTTKGTTAPTAKSTGWSKIKLSKIIVRSDDLFSIPQLI